MAKIKTLQIGNDLIIDPRSIDRQAHSAYVKWCGWAGLHENVEVDAYKDTQVHFFHDRYCFTADDMVIADWKLTPSATDKMFQYAIKTFLSAWKKRGPVA
jgi:hypothetical protein